MYPKFKKISIGIMLAIFAFVTLAGSLLTVRPVYAMPVEITADIPRLTTDIFTKIGKMLEIALVNASINAIGYFTRKMAYDMAVGLATGNKGQSPLASWDNFGDSVRKAADEAGGKALEKLGQPFGLNLCQIPDPRLDLAIRIGLHLKYMECDSSTDPTCGKPACTLSDAYDAWSNTDTWASRWAGATKSPEERFNEALQLSQSDFGIYLTASEKIDQARIDARFSASGQRTEDQGFKGVTDLISGNIKTPGQVVKKQFEDTSPSEQQKMSQQQIWGTFGAGMAQVIPSGMSVFLNTYLSMKLNQLLDKGMIPTPGSSGGLPGSFEEGPQFGGLEAAQKLFSDYLVTTVSAVENYDLASELNACPDIPGPNNCAADEGIIQALQQGNYGNKAPTTIREALEKGWLHGDWKLIPPTREADQNRDCYNKAYCHANIKVLRKARVLPLGFEIAAAQSDANSPWTLKQVVDGFDDCVKDAQGQIVNDKENKPFCHLIDPNWVIKLPPTRCKAMAYGAFPVAEGVAERNQECVDVQSCVGYDSSGKCVAYGYCTREKNVWRFTADKCDAQFTTCRAFKDSTGRQVAYLYRTLDTGSCTADNVGCSAYSLSQTGNYYWQGPDVPDAADGFVNNAIYFNKNLQSNCSANSAGCSAFKPVVPISGVDKISLKKAPDYFNCYDTNLNNDVMDWPQTAADLARLAPKPDCKNYADVCIPDEVGCNWYTPVSFGGDRVPGKFTPATVVAGEGGAQTVAAWNDQCDAQCVGYAAFRELPSNYSAGQNISFIIPPNKANAGTVKTCSLAEVGCSSFTNLSQNVGQMEKIEYYSYLRTCILPDNNLQKNFYTYEGTLTQGYQLKAYTLVKDDGGAPKYFYRVPADLTAYSNICSADLYRTGAADPDCRQFNDDQGNTYYRLLSKTVVVSPQCTPYRLNTPEFYTETALNTADSCAAQKGFWDNGRCSLCFQNGEYRDGFCFYMGLPSGTMASEQSSNACSANVESCREYKGNSGNNIETVFANKFEGVAAEATANWSSTGGNVSQSTESTHAEEHSITHSGGGDLYRNLIEMTNNPQGGWLGESYVITFWAKGSGTNLTVKLANGEEGNFGTATVDNVWKFYKLGPVEMPGSSLTNPQVLFRAANDSPLFVDNVEFTKVKQNIYLVKKTLNVPGICDSNPNDNLPGEALGCSEFSDIKNSPFYLTNFSFLCRDKAIGCTALFDTFNTDTTGTSTYNIWMAGAGGTERKLAGILGSDGNELTCRIASGDSGCYIKSAINYSVEQITRAGGQIVTSTIVIPPDTSEATPMYLVANDNSSCRPADLGCTLAGAQTLTAAGARYTTTTIKNDPASYDKTLCQSEAVGCMSYSADQGNFYFKDPVMLGQKVCEYKEDATVRGVKTKGWFWKDVGQCRNVLRGVFGVGGFATCSSSNDCPDQKVCSGNPGGGYLACKNDDECGGGMCVDSCEKTEPMPCYQNYFTDGSTYNIWSYGNKQNYDNFVGECPVAQSGCTTFIDHNSKDQYGQPEKYYMIRNNKFAASEKECNGQVSEREGCILLDNADWPNKMWNTKESYVASANVDYKLVNPIGVASGADNDANTIIKVARDRECAEWLYCNRQRSVIDVDTGRPDYKCYGVGLCSEAQSGNKESSQCSKPVTKTDGIWLSDDIYRSRDVSWGGKDFSGLSMFEKFPVVNYEVVKTARDDMSAEEYYLSKIDKNDCLPADFGKGKKGLDNNADGNQDGWCLQKGESDEGIISYPIGGISSPWAVSFAHEYNNPEKRACRGYPEKDSPFSKPGVDEKIKYENANICSGTDCDCSYKKVFYGKNNEKVKYYNQNDENIKSSICNGGQYSDYPCENIVGITEDVCTSAGGSVSGGVYDKLCVNKVKDNDQNPISSAIYDGVKIVNIAAGSSVNSTICQSGGGTCLNKQGEKYFDGWQGYCIDRDQRRKVPGAATGGNNQNACLTWMPTDVMEGINDIFAFDAGAKFSLEGDRYLCLKNSPPLTSQYSGSLSGYVTSDTNRRCYNEFFGVTSAKVGREPCDNALDGLQDTCYTSLPPDEFIDQNNFPGQSPPVQVNYTYDPNMEERTSPDPGACWHWAGGSNPNGRENNYFKMVGFELGDIPVEAWPVKRTDFFIKSNGDDDHRERYFTLKSQDVFGGQPDINHEYLRRGEINRFDVYFDAERKVYADDDNHDDGEEMSSSWDNITPNFVSILPNEPEGQPLGVAFKKVQSIVFRRGNVEVNNALSYLEWKDYGNFSPTDADTSFFRFGSSINFNAPSSFLGGATSLQSGLGIRLVFDKGVDANDAADDRLLGAWLSVSDNLDGEADIGFIFVIHFANGECSAFAKINDNDQGNKAVTWRLRRNEAKEFDVADRDSESFVAQRVETMNNIPFGLAKQNIDYGKTIFVSPYTKVWGVDDLNLFGRLFNSGVDFGGVPMTIYMNSEDSNDYNPAACASYDRNARGNVNNSYCYLLDYMFAKVYGFKEKSGGGYSDVPVLSGAIIDAASPNVAAVDDSKQFNYYVPKIASPILDYKACPEWEKKGCGINRLNAFAVNEQDSGDLYIQGSGDVVVRMYAWADGAQMPLKRVMVDFNDSYGVMKMESRAISNYKPLCYPEEAKTANSSYQAQNKHCQFDVNIPCASDADCQKIEGHKDDPARVCTVTYTGDNQRFGFGNTSPANGLEGTGCKEGMFEFQNTYACDPTEIYKMIALGENWKTRKDLCYNPGNTDYAGHFAVVGSGDCSVAVNPKYKLAAGTIVCAYKPKVQVIDNWGWCNGTCARSINDPVSPMVVSAPEDGCYNEAYPYTGSPRTIRLQCSGALPIEKQDPWLEYDGNIIVIPATQK